MSVIFEDNPQNYDYIPGIGMQIINTTNRTDLSQSHVALGSHQPRIWFVTKTSNLSAQNSFYSKHSILQLPKIFDTAIKIYQFNVRVLMTLLCGFIKYYYPVSPKILQQYQISNWRQGSRICDNRAIIVSIYKCQVPMAAKHATVIITIRHLSRPVSVTITLFHKVT